ncbi:nucleoside triphosphate pyrophosphohydrolase [Alteromonas sp. CYL-A6]|uniref:nucleoside triphosphate pyrophosphohydrolase n=1 Tax=Alteromonas nitratireducens TaxID=3390813 RepID=UPI0034B978FE
MSDVSNTNPEHELHRLLTIMARLRDPETGCPWDVRQSMASLTRYTIEEAYEVADAIHTNQSADSVCNELGDLLFQVVFYARIAEERGDFTFFDVCRAISDKLERRHPHVFGDGDRNADLSAQWEAIKAAERTQEDNDSVLSGIPSGLPSLTLAVKMQKKAASVGFDWPDIDGVMDKVREEVGEVQTELNAASVNKQAVEEEIGDLLFAIVNLARHAEVDPDTALRNASHKFSARFKQVEQLANSEGKDLRRQSLDELEALWCIAKQRT